MRKRYLLAFISKTVMNWVHDKHVGKKKKKNSLHNFKYL